MAEGKPKSQPRFLQPISPLQLSRGRERQLSGEQRLMVAVLEDAIECFQKGLFAGNPQQQRLFREATTWLWNGQPGQPFSFEEVCHGLDLNPDYIRRGLAQWRERQIEALRAGKAVPRDRCGRNSKC